MSDQLTAPIQQTLLQTLGKYKNQIEGVVARQIDPRRFTRMIVAQIQKTPKLTECSAISVVNATLQAATMGLEIRTNQAYLVPFYNSKLKRMECTLLIDYRGKIDLATRSGRVTDITAQLVRAADNFTCSFGLRPEFIHEPLLLRKDENGWAFPIDEKERGPVVLGYATARLKSEELPHIEVMTLQEIEAIRARSRSATNGPWVTDWNQMARKTLIHRIFNYLPQSSEMALSQEVDEKFDLDIPLDPLLEADAADEDRPLVEQSAQAQIGALEEGLTKQGLPPEQVQLLVGERQAALDAKEEKKRAKAVPVFDEFPSTQGLPKGYICTVKGKDYEHVNGKFHPLMSS